MSKKTKYTKAEKIQLVIYSTLSIISYILTFYYMENYFTHPCLILFFSLGMISSLLVFIPIYSSSKRIQEEEEQAYLEYLSTLTEKELQIELIRLQKSQNESIKLAILASFINRRL